MPKATVAAPAAASPTARTLPTFASPVPIFWALDATVLMVLEADLSRPKMSNVRVLLGTPRHRLLLLFLPVGCLAHVDAPPHVGGFPDGVDGYSAAGEEVGDERQVGVDGLLEVA